MISEEKSGLVTIASCLQVTAVMNSDLVCVSSDAYVSDAAARMAERRTGSCLVIDDGVLRGVITEQDLSRKVVAASEMPAEVPVTAIMSSPVVTIGTGKTVGDVADLMILHNIRRVVVVEDDRAVGIVTARDLLGFASEMNTIMQDLSGMYGTLMFLNHDMQVLWVNRQPGEPDTGSGSGPVYCYELLHGSKGPCHGCPLVLSGTSPENTVRTSEVIDKEHRIWQVQCHPVNWRNGKVLGVIESAIEVTREREMERTLREHRNLLQIAVEGASIETWYFRENLEGTDIGADGGVAFASNSRFSGTGDMFGYLQKRMHPDDLPLFKEMMESLIAGKDDTGEVRSRIIVPGGGWRWVRTVGRVIETAPDGKALVIAGVNIDITDLTNYQSAMHRANKKLNLLASVTRHDVLNQVSAIMLAGELLSLNGYMDGESELAQILRQIIDSAGTIERQTLFTREYHGLGEMDPGWQNVCLFAEDAGKEFGQDAIDVLCECEGLEVYADPMFRNVIFNLIDNAIRHGTDTPTLTVRFTDSEDGGLLIIEDDGSGVPADLKERIFTRGYGKNTGFGLFLTREILEITGISIHECGEPGQGARFEMLIPHSGYRFT